MAAADAARLTLEEADPAVDPRHLQSVFDAVMADFGPWETAPVLAVAVSGGADSLAACILADRWARTCGGKAVALTVDHGLRPGSGAEARQVGAWLNARQIEQRVLVWTGGKPQTGLQDAARQARYDLLQAASQDIGALHLLTGHHQDDQIETIRMRAARRATGPGTAGMAAVVELPHCRLLRPLLDVRKAALRAFLTTRKQQWIEDPSNRSPAFERGALRANPPGRSAEAGLLKKAAAAASDRSSAETAAAGLLAQHGRMHPGGALFLDDGALDCDPPTRNALIASVITTIGGGAYSPSPDRVHVMGNDLRDPSFAGATLGGCQIERHDLGLVFFREAGRAGPPAAVAPDAATRWDNRFDVSAGGATPGAGLTIGPLGERGWATVDRDIREAVKAALPPAARASLPALYVDGELAAAPHLPFTKGFPPDWRLHIRFRPGRPLTTAGFRPFANLAGRKAGIV